VNAAQSLPIPLSWFVVVDEIPGEVPPTTGLNEGEGKHRPNQTDPLNFTKFTDF